MGSSLPPEVFRIDLKKFIEKLFYYKIPLTLYLQHGDGPMDEIKIKILPMCLLRYCFAGFVTVLVSTK